MQTNTTGGTSDRPRNHLRPGEVVEETVNDQGHAVYIIINTRTLKVTGAYRESLTRGKVGIHMADLDKHVSAVTIQQMLAKYDPLA